MGSTGDRRWGYLLHYNRQDIYVQPKVNSPARTPLWIWKATMTPLSTEIRTREPSSSLQSRAWLGRAAHSNTQQQCSCCQLPAGSPPRGELGSSDRRGQEKATPDARGPPDARKNKDAALAAQTLHGWKPGKREERCQCSHISKHVTKINITSSVLI